MHETKLSILNRSNQNQSDGISSVYDHSLNRLIRIVFFDIIIQSEIWRNDLYWIIFERTNHYIMIDSDLLNCPQNRHRFTDRHLTHLIWYSPPPHIALNQTYIHFVHHPKCTPTDRRPRNSSPEYRLTKSSSYYNRFDVYKKPIYLPRKHNSEQNSR